MYKKLQRGFTIIELMIVVILIGLIAAAALPRMTDAINSARAERDVRMMLVFLKSARSLAIADNQMIRIFDEDEASTIPYKFSGPLKAFYNKLNKNDYTQMKAAAKDCTGECVKLTRPAVSSKAKTALYYVADSGLDSVAGSVYGADLASIAFDANGSFYASDRGAYPFAPNDNEWNYLVWHYNLENKQYAIVLCPSGIIRLFQGASAVIPASITGIITLDYRFIPCKVSYEALPDEIL